MNVPYDLLIRWLNTNNEFREYTQNKYKTELEYFDRFRKRNGTNCPIARSAIKRIFQLEFAERGDKFIELISAGVWRPYKS
jgi:hypothetical protein